ncbi:MAG: hypothetical protein JW708_06940, partial [Vallitaleaceae bacterium]|nr:hypothetical protein [Vallitaleaceae bacterium]
TKQLGIAFFGYLVFTLFMTIGALATNKVLILIFIAIDFLFLGLGFSTIGIMKETMHQVAAIAELIIAILSFYGSGAIIVNGAFGKVVLPIGKAVLKKN